MSGFFVSVRCGAAFQRKGGTHMYMYTSVKVGDILKKKGRGFWAVAPKTTAFDALSMMADKDIGALLVMEGQRLIGIFSERDYARKVILKGKSSKTTAVEELMSSPVITAGPELNLQECMILMAGNHIRHLPVMDEGAVIGVLSTRNVVETVISSQEATIHQLEDYISGEDYAVKTAR